MNKIFSILTLIAAFTMSCYAQPSHFSELPSQYFTLHDSIQVHYKVWDHQQPNAPLQTLCFVHGLGSDMNAWEKQFEGLRDEANFRLVFIDLPGYGQSSKPYTDYTLALFGQALDGLLNNLHITTTILVGHNLGTPVCRLTMLATTHIGGLVDIDGAYCFYDNTAPEYVEPVESFAAAFEGSPTPQYVASSTLQNLVDRNYWPQFAMPLDVVTFCSQSSAETPDRKQKLEALFPLMDYTELTASGRFVQMEQPEPINTKLKEYAAKIKANALEDYDFAIRNLEQNYAGFCFKVNDTNRNEWNTIKQQLRDSVATAAYYAPELISDLCCWFGDHHLSCSYRNSSTRFPNVKANYASQMQTYAPKQLSARVDDDTWVLRFPTWQGDDNYQKWVSDAVEEYRQSGCSRLIVDLRGNGGGNDSQYAPVLNLLYRQPGFSDGMLLRNTQDNRDRCLELVGDNEWWKELMDRCAADTAAYVTIFQDEEIQKEVDAHRPKQAAVIIDKRVASSSEQLLLELRAVAPDVKVYGKDNTMGCIDISNIRVARLPHAPNGIGIPVTVSKRVTEGRTLIDGVGIAPDVTIDLPLPDTLTDNVDSWVTWVAARMGE